MISWISDVQHHWQLGLNNPVLWGAVLCIVECWVASLASIHQIPVATAHHQIVTKMSTCVCAQPCLILCDPTNSCVYQAPLSMEISRQKYWSGLIFSPPGDLSHTGIEPTSLVSPASAGDSSLLFHLESQKKSPDIAKCPPGERRHHFLLRITGLHGLNLPLKLKI